MYSPGTSDPESANLQVKGNVYKNKRVLMEAIHKQKAEKIREKAIADQFEARRAKNKSSRERKLARREERLSSVRPPPQLSDSLPAFLSTLSCAGALNQYPELLRGGLPATMIGAVCCGSSVHIPSCLAGVTLSAVGDTISLC